MQACIPQLGDFSIAPWTWGFTSENSNYGNNAMTIFCKDSLNLRDARGRTTRDQVFEPAVRVNRWRASGRREISWKGVHARGGVRTWRIRIVFDAPSEPGNAHLNSRRTALSPDQTTLCEVLILSRLTRIFTRVYTW